MSNKVLLSIFLSITICLFGFSGCISDNSAAFYQDTNDGSFDSENIFDTISTYYGTWKVSGLYQFPMVAECSENEAIRAEGEYITLNEELFSGYLDINDPEYSLDKFTVEELHNIGLVSESVERDFSDGATVITVCDVKSSYTCCYLIICDTDKIIYISPSNYIFQLERA